MSLATGASEGGSSGSLSLSTGASSGGAGGSVSIAVGAGTSGAGGSLSLTAGETSSESGVGGSVSVSGGKGGAAGGNVVVSGGAGAEAGGTLSLSSGASATGSSGSVQLASRPMAAHLRRVASQRCLGGWQLRRCVAFVWRIEERQRRIVTIGVGAGGGAAGGAVSVSAGNTAAESGVGGSARLVWWRPVAQVATSSYAAARGSSGARATYPSRAAVCV